MQADPEEMLKNSRDMAQRARKYMAEAKKFPEGSKEREVLEARAEELLTEAIRWTGMVNKMVAS